MKSLFPDDSKNLDTIPESSDSQLSKDIRSQVKWKLDEMKCLSDLKWVVRFSSAFTPVPAPDGLEQGRTWSVGDTC